MLTATFSKIKKYGNAWGLRVSGDPQPGEIVRVSKRNGSEVFVKVGRKVADFGTATLCTIDASREAPIDATPAEYTERNASDLNVSELPEQPQPQPQPRPIYNARRSAWGAEQCTCGGAFPMQSCAACSRNMFATS